MSGLPLVEGILKYIEENNVLFCMPGHKGGRGFLNTPEGRIVYENLLKADITEVDGLDNLHHPEGIIKSAQELLSRFYGSKKSYFLVNGSTSGNLAMIFSALNENDKVIVERNCHRSIFNGIIMRKLRPVYIKSQINEFYNAPLSIDLEHYFHVIRSNQDAKAVIITYPNYYGVCSDLKAIISEARKYGMKVLVDSAHGAHFGINKLVPRSAVELGADMVVMSAHKTLPSLTQTSYLHIGDNTDVEKTDFYVSAFLSTSPSYMFMASMDYARFYLEEYGSLEYEKLISRANVYREKINELGFIHVLGKGECEFFDVDLTRYVIHSKEGLSGHKLLDYLRLRKIQCEMSDESNVILIFSTVTLEEDFEKLYTALKECNLEEIKEVNNKKLNHSFDFLNKIPDTRLLPYEAMNNNKIKVSLKDSVGRVCAKAIVPYPPGVPLTMIGEIIDEECINVIKYYLENTRTVLGVEDRKVTVVEGY